jgi:hypothetical protein
MKRLLPLLLVLACLPLSGCGEVRERSTRNEILQLAFRTAQMDQALALCDAEGKLSTEHAAAWTDAFEEADGWIGLSSESIAARRAAGREAFDGVPESACPQVRQMARASIGEAKRWGERIASKRLCSLVGCEN